MCSLFTWLVFIIHPCFHSKEQPNACKQEALFLLLCSFISVILPEKVSEMRKPIVLERLEQILVFVKIHGMGEAGVIWGCLSVTLLQFFSVWLQVHEEQRTYFRLSEMMWRDSLWVTDTCFLKSPKCSCGNQFFFIIYLRITVPFV